MASYYKDGDLIIKFDGDAWIWKCGYWLKDVNCGYAMDVMKGNLRGIQKPDDVD